eukprot:768821-Hanusia_phi.AAC.9
MVRWPMDDMRQRFHLSPQVIPSCLNFLSSLTILSIRESRSMYRAARTAAEKNFFFPRCFVSVRWDEDEAENETGRAERNRRREESVGQVRSGQDGRTGREADERRKEDSRRGERSKVKQRVGRGEIEGRREEKGRKQPL